MMVIFCDGKIGPFTKRANNGCGKMIYGNGKAGGFSALRNTAGITPASLVLL
jgi:hypothetical protein